MKRAAPLCLLALIACSDDPLVPGGPGADGGTADRGSSDAAETDLGQTDATPADAAPSDAIAEDSGPPIDGGVEDGGENLGTWQACAPLRRGPRQETAVVALQNEIYVIGGFNNAGQIVTTVEAYDAVQDTWRDIADLPQAMHHANAAAHNDRLYVLGFLRGNGFATDARSFVYNPGDDTWAPIASMPQGTETGGGAAATIGDRIFVAGGLRALSSVTTVEAYSPMNNSWEPFDPMPEPLDHLVAVAFGGELFVIGGRSGGITGHTTRVDAYEPVGRSWRSRAAMPTSRGGAAAAVLGGRVYVFGGEGNPAPGSRGVFHETEAYDFAGDRWISLAPMPIPRHGTGAASLADRIVVPGGATQQAFGAVDTCEVFFPPP